MGELNVLEKIYEPIFFVTNDAGRAIGLEDRLPNFHIICLDDHPLVDLLKKKGISVFCLEKLLGKKNAIFRSSGEILFHPDVIRFIREKSRNKTPNICFFKPQAKIERQAKENNYNLIGNSVFLNRIFENKISFFKICDKERIPIPKGEIVILKNIDFDKAANIYQLPLVIQFGYGWAGTSTHFINSEKELLDLKKKYSNYLVKLSEFIDGITVLNNGVIYKNNIVVSEPALQIHSEEELSSLYGATGGRQWPAKLTLKQKEEIFNISQQVGKIMIGVGYRGFFGLDFLIEKKTQKVYLSENNSRLTASTPFYTKLELSQGYIPLLFLHILSFLENSKVKLFENFTPRKVMGSEIVARNTENYPIIVHKSLLPGIYDKQGNFLSEEYFLNSSKKDVYWITLAAEGRIVNPEIELFRLNCLSEVCDDGGFLKKDFVSVIKRIKNKIKKEKC